MELKRAFFWLTIGLFPANAALAIPTHSFDLDTSLSGIQSARTVTVGSIFDIDVVYSGDGSTDFDAAIMDVFFDPSVVRVAPGTTPLAGQLAATLSLDVYGGAFASVGGPLATLFPPISSVGGVGLAAFGTNYIPGASQLTMFRFTFEALSETSATSFAVGALPPSTSVLALDGVGVEAFSMQGLLTIRAPGVPEPGVVWLLALGSASMIRSRRSIGWRRNH